MPGLCVQLATVWSLIEGAPLSANRGDEPPEIPEAAIAGVRETMDRMVGSYLTRRGKKRYCDKSLGTARYAELLLRVYPNARFICLYRHPMDVIASGAEACPWGLNGYGFEPYIASTPGNVVLALANFWADNVRATLAVEERFPDKCLRLRYEDLVAIPEAAVAEVFNFLGVAAAPGISDACFSAERERFGPADHKIWYTSQINSDSVGRGWSVPVAMIAPQLLDLINEMAGKLGYLTIDGEWGTTEPPSDVRVPSAAMPAQADEDAGTVNPASWQDLASHAAQPGSGAGPIDQSPRSERLGERLRAGLNAVTGRRAAERWNGHGSETFVAVALTKDPRHPAEYWLVDLGAATVTLATKQAQENSDWDMIGSYETWQKILDREVNLSVALRSCALRYCDNGEASPLAADTRIGLAAELLGVATWRVRTAVG